ncbi:MAG: discoidin domain-containing protein [Pseudoflavonifractor sp.]|nr:discoidin domain-containing protein [Pseudoflavonifractor sp.]
MVIRQYLAAVAVAACAMVQAQEPVAVGRGSYASFPPLSYGRTDAHGGDQSTLMQTKRLWVTEREGEPIPTNDWWTGLINAPFADALWSYPAMVRPAETGVTVCYPTYWNDNGTEVKWSSHLEVRGDDFVASCAIADSWHDWDVEMLMPSVSGGRSMRTTLAHGMPFTWIELEGVFPRVVMSGDATFFSTTGRELTPAMLPSVTSSALGVRIGGDCYGIYLPAGCRLSYNGQVLSVDGDEAPAYIVVALLPTEAHLGEYAGVALNVPRDTRVSWEYDERRGEIASTWTVDAVNLDDGSRGDVLQGFLPHAVKGAVKAPAFGTDTYLTPRGTMRMAEGRQFGIVHKFAGMLPWYAAPKVDDARDNPFRPEVMADLMGRYARGGSFGEDTYWGGKGLTQMALNMTFALQLGDLEAFEMSRDRLKSTLVDWLTYTPGEKNMFFARYPRWGGLVGEATSYDSDTFNDHHFHYGYFTLAGALLCMVDEDFKAGYGPMLREIAKDYANWDRGDKRYPFLRTMDPWVGHSYAGGLGDQGNSNGNGQESSSESMQGWGGVYLLGVALGDREMRDAGIFGWSTEARATREYWFDVDSRFDKHGDGGNYDYTLYKSPYNSNITCKGIGWWTWFGGDPLYMHGIQWMPVSPALDYLSWDLDFVKWAYDDLMASPGWGHSWFEDGVDPGGNKVDRLASNDWGNVVLAYMQRALPAEAAAIFDRAYYEGLGIATNISTGHISYYLIHSHLTYGDIDTSVHADIPSANAFVNDAGVYTWMVYNPGEERVVTFYRDGSEVHRVKAPARRFSVFTADAAPAEIVMESESGSRFLDSSRFTATVLDQYGATVDGTAVIWDVADKSVGRIDSRGLFTVDPSAAIGSSTDVTASCSVGGKVVSASMRITVSEPSRLSSGVILPSTRYVERGASVDFRLDGADQYGDEFAGDVEWKINGVTVSSPHVDGSQVGVYEIEAVAGDKSVTHSLYVTPPLADLALGRVAVSSSEENAGTLTANATDGDPSTRWGSRHVDGEWIYVDLGRDCMLTRVGVEWEAAYASEYLIQSAPDGVAMESYTGSYVGGNKTVDVPAESAWATLSTVSGVSAGGLRTTAVDGMGRYLRIKALSRGTSYGISILSLSVYGIPADVTAGEPIGMDISSPSSSVDEDKTMRFTANIYDIVGNRVESDVRWSVSAGVVTGDGLFTPAGYGEATVTATTGAGFSASRAVMVNEVIKPSRLEVTPSAMTVVAGESASFKMSCLDQFGGDYPLTLPVSWAVVMADGSPAPEGAVTVDTTAGVVSAVTPGEYTVTLSMGTVSVDIPVTVAALEEVNIALGRPARAGSGNNPGAVFDGDSSTRWQALPGGEQWIDVELDGLYAVDRFILTWEGACAVRYHIEVSSDGQSWSTVVRNEAAPSSATGMTQTLVTDAVPARYVRVVPDELGGFATQYGMSLFEVEVYATGRLDSNDSEAPVVMSADFDVSGGVLRVNALASDNSGYVTYTVTADGVSAVDAPRLTSGAIARTGMPVTVELPLPGDCILYRCVLTASDAAGNSVEVSRSVTVAPVSVVGVNLALGKPVEVSSVENQGLGGANAVDGSQSTRWGSSFADNQWLCVDIEAVYNVTEIVIVTTDAGAYARKALIEYSVDGDRWETLTVRERSGVGTDRIAVADKRMRYLRYTGVERSSQYGTTLTELEVYGDRRMLSVVSEEDGTLRLSGEWDDEAFAAIDDVRVTGYDMLAVTGLPASLSVVNPNCVIYTATPLSADCNVVTVSADGAVASSFNLYAGHDFRLAMDVKVNGMVNFYPTVSVEAMAPAGTVVSAESKNPVGSMAAVLPFDLRSTQGVGLYRIVSVEDGVVGFAPVDAVPANTPFILRSSDALSVISAADVTLKATPAVMADGIHEAVYRGTMVDDVLVYDSATECFVSVSDDIVPPFGSYIYIGDDSPLKVNIATTMMDDVTSDSDNAKVSVYTVDGRPVRLNVRPDEAVRGLAPGFYIVGGEKRLVTPGDR